MMVKTVLVTAFALCLVVITSPGFAQVTSRIAPPALTFAVDNNGALRPLIGIAAAAAIGAPIDLGFAITQFAIPPNHDYIVATAVDQSATLLQLHEGAISARPMAELASIDRIAISVTGTAAAFFSKSAGCVWAFVNLSDSPRLVEKYDVGELGPLSAFAISDDGRTLIWGTSDGVEGSLFVLKPSQAPGLITTLSHPSAIEFLHNSDSAIVADDVGNAILSIIDGQVFTVATAGDGISGPIGIAVSNDNQRIFVGNSKAGSVTTINGLTAISEPTYCNCNLTGLFPTNTDSVFRITEFSGGPILLFDGNPAGPRITFVPVAAPN